MLTDNSFSTRCIAVTAIVVMLVMGVLGCTSTKPAEKLKILTHNMSRLESGEPVVKGTAKNVSSHTINYAEVAVDFYDGESLFVLTSQDNIINLAAGGIWSFEVKFYYNNPEVVNFYHIRVGTVR